MRYLRKRTLAVAIALLFTGGAAVAQTISYADAVTQLANDCGADIKKLCDGLNLGSNRIADCLKQHSGQVSGMCLSSLATVSASIERREQAQSNYSKACAHDMQQRCRGIHGDGNMLGCLIKAEKRVRSECTQAIRDAGWR